MYSGQQNKDILDALGATSADGLQPVAPLRIV